MSTEARIVAPQTKIGARPTTSGTEPKEEEPTKKRGKSKVMTLVGGLIVVGAIAGYWFLMGPGAGAPADEAAEPSVAAEPEYELGEVVVVDSISINLEGGHYLRLGLGLQLTADAGGHGAAIDSAKALDAAIALFSGRTTEELADAHERELLKEELAETLKELYHEEVVGVYYTDFVTQ